MRAAVCTRYGPPDVVRVIDVDKPTVTEDGVLIKVYATTVNRTDCGFRSATPFFVRLLTGIRRPCATVLGGEFAGVIEAVGRHVTSFRAGDRVFGFSGFSFGAHAEYLSLPAKGWLTTMPANLTFEEAAPSTEGSQYALAFVHSAKVQRGHDVLVYGASGAIGSAAVQLLKSVGATVTAVCDTSNVDLVRSLGADRVVDYIVEDFRRDTQRYDAVFDAVGKSSFRRCKRLLRPRGIYLSSDLGRLGQNPVLMLVTPLFGGRRVKFPMQRQSGPDMVRYFRELMESGAFRPVVDRTYPLDRIVEAYEYVETGQKIGNVVISVVPPP